MCAVSMIIQETHDDPYKQYRDWDVGRWKEWVDIIKETKKQDDKQGLKDCESLDKLGFLNELDKHIAKVVKRELRKILKEGLK